MERRETRGFARNITKSAYAEGVLRVAMTFLISLCRQGGTVLPFGLSLVAASSGKMLIPSAVGALLGYMAQGGIESIRYAAGVAVLTGVRIIFKDSPDIRSVWWFEPTLAATVTLSTGLALMLGGDGGRMFLIEAAAAWIGTRCFSLANKALIKLAGGEKISATARLSVLLSLCIAAYSTLGVAAALGALAAGVVMPQDKEEARPFERKEQRTRRIAKVMRDMTEGLKQRGDGPLSTEIFSPVIERVCTSCKQNHRCYGERYNDMTDNLSNMALLMRRGMPLAECDLPEPFVSTCINKAAFIAEATAEASLFESTRRYRKEALGDVALLREQYSCFSTVLDDLGEAMDSPETKDTRLTDRLLQTLPTGSTVMAAYGRHGKLKIEGFVKDDHPNLSPMIKMAENVSGRKLSSPSITRTDGGCTFKTSEALSFSLSVKRHISPSPGENVAGDALRDFVTEDNKAVVVLSDGMGAGRQAYSKSRMATDCIEKLMQAGLGRESALHVLNSAMLIGSDPEVYATLDVAILDMYSGELEFIKAGAAPSFLIRGESITKIDSRTLPAGILPILEPEVYRTRVTYGDRIVMLSDGVLPIGEEVEGFEELIKREDINPRAIVNHAKNALKGQKDDMTAALIKIDKKQ